jgi:hypothetical protein
VGTPTLYWLVDQEWIFGWGKILFCSSPHQYRLCGPTDPPTQWVQEAPFSELKLSEIESNDIDLLLRLRMRVAYNHFPHIY